MHNSEEIIITGINGFVGEHLARNIKQLGYTVRGIGRDNEANEKVSGIIDSYESVNLLDRTSVEGTNFSAAKAIIHLAGLASVGESFDKPELYRTGNAAMTGNILEVSAAQGFTGRTLVVSTGGLYDPNQPLPLSEESKIALTSPYAEGKVKAEEVTRQHIALGSKAVIVRPFNHIGPGQGNGFLLPDLYQSLLTAKENNSSTISVGNLSTRRDYTDVRDIVSAYTLLALAPSLNHDLYNICSGASLSGNDILALLQDATGTTEITTETDPSRIRPTDPQELVGDSSRLQHELGWKPILSLDQTVKDFVNEKKAQ